MPKPTAAKTAVSSKRQALSDTTANQILDAAEALFAAHGYGGTSMRAIAERANANLGAFHYYWGSKQALCKAVLERRLGPVMKERKERLDAFEGRKVPLRDILRASMAPSLLVAGASAQERESFRAFYGRMLMDPADEVHALTASIVDDFARRFVDVVSHELPHLSSEEFYWRVIFVYGAFFYAHSTHTRVQALWPEKLQETSMEAGVDYLVNFIEAGLKAKPAPRSAG